MAMTAAMSGTTTTMSHDSVASSRTAMITPPTARIGAETRIVRAICKKSCTCWTAQGADAEECSQRSRDRCPLLGRHLRERAAQPLGRAPLLLGEHAFGLRREP